MNSEEISLTKDVSAYKELSKRWIWSNLSPQQHESLGTYSPWDILVIAWRNIYIERKNQKQEIQQTTKLQLNKQRENLPVKEYNDNLLWYNKKLSWWEIRNLFSRYIQKESKIETLINSWILVTYLKQKVIPKINVDWNWYICYVDTQLQRSFLIHTKNWQLQVMWYVEVSSWDKQRNKWKFLPWVDRYWDTPSIIIKMKKWFWRSNPNNWKDFSWYWKRWSRVFSLGNYSLKNGISVVNDKEKLDLALAMHKTSPKAEKNLWKKMSHWCIRTDRIMIDILDNLEKQNLFDYTIIWDYKKNQSPIVPE